MIDLNGLGSNLSGMGSRFTDGVGVGLNGGLLQPGKAALAGKFLAQSSKFAAIPGVAAAAAAFEPLLQGDLVGAGGGAAGAAGAALAAKAIAPAAIAVNPLLGAGLLLAAPVLGGMAGKTLANNIAGGLSQPAQAATTAVGNQLNPGSMRNVADGTVEKILETSELIKQQRGEDLANAYLQQALGIQTADDLDESRAKRALRMAPARNASRLAELAAQGGIQMGLKGMDGVNTVLGNITASNPYAQMLVS